MKLEDSCLDQENKFNINGQLDPIVEQVEEFTDLKKKNRQIVTSVGRNNFQGM